MHDEEGPLSASPDQSKVVRRAAVFRPDQSFAPQESHSDSALKFGLLIRCIIFDIRTAVLVPIMVTFTQEGSLQKICFQRGRPVGAASPRSAVLQWPHHRIMSGQVPPFPGYACGSGCQVEIATSILCDEVRNEAIFSP